MVTALRAEARTLAGTAGRARVRPAGAGAAAAAAVAGALLDEGAACLVSWGLAAALAPGLEAGTLLVPDALVGVDGRLLEPTGRWREAFVAAVPGAVAGRLAEAEAPLLDPSDKAALGAGTGARGADMESAAVARVAAAAGVPFLVVRAVSDPAHAPVPGFAARATGPRGELRPHVVLAGLVREPAALGQILRLSAGFRAGLRTLASAAALAGPGLCLPALPATLGSSAPARPVS